LSRGRIDLALAMCPVDWTEWADAETAFSLTPRIAAGRSMSTQKKPQTLDQGLRRRCFRIALAHQVSDIHVQLLRQVSEGPELLGTRGSDVGGETVEFWLWHGGG
jgi:hypothetical protein